MIVPIVWQFLFTGGGAAAVSAQPSRVGPIVLSQGGRSGPITQGTGA